MGGEGEKEKRKKKTSGLSSVTVICNRQHLFSKVFINIKTWTVRGLEEKKDISSYRES